MLLVVVALGSQVAAPCLHAGRAAGETNAGWGSYRRGLITEAATRFAVADSLCPGDHGTQVGLGFVRLRQRRGRGPPPPPAGAPAGQGGGGAAGGRGRGGAPCPRAPRPARRAAPRPRPP